MEMTSISWEEGKELFLRYTKNSKKIKRSEAQYQCRKKAMAQNWKTKRGIIRSEILAINELDIGVVPSVKYV
jgi:hypothetical protein